jgi:hypothetical protein
MHRVRARRTAVQRRPAAWVLAGLAILGCAGNSPAIDPEAGEYDWGFFASRFADVHGDTRFRVLGPFYEDTVSENGDRFRAIRPFTSKTIDAAAERALRESLWPLLVSKSFREQFSVRSLFVYYLNSDVNDPESRWRLFVVPFYFQGRSEHGEDYLAVFPFAGTLREFIGQDEIKFTLFPIRMTSSLNEIKTSHWVWPIYSRTSGKGIYRFRLVPFYGQSRQRDNYEKKFILWPFWTTAQYMYPESHGDGYILWPLFGRLDLSDQKSWMVLPPFFRVTRGDRLFSADLPYPFIQYRSGETEKLYLFPLWGHKTTSGSYNSFFLWPIFHRMRYDKPDGLYYRTLALPCFHSDTLRARAGAGEDPGEILARHWTVWPLLSWRREGEESRLRALELWPLKFTGPIERNYAPFWTLYTRTALGDHVQTEFLWGWVRHHRRGRDFRYVSVFPFFQYRREGLPAANRSFSLLKGLVGYERSGDLRRYRLLYGIRWGGEERAP